MVLCLSIEQIFNQTVFSALILRVGKWIYPVDFPTIVAKWILEAGAILLCYLRISLGHCLIKYKETISMVYGATK